jgi:hypothetical protein
MPEPCSEKENIDKLFKADIEKMSKLHDMELRQVAIQGDVSHIKTRIDNGMSHTIKDIHEKLTELHPVIKHHDDIVKRIEDFGWLISRVVVTGVLTTIAGLIIWAIGKGFVVKL